MAPASRCLAAALLLAGACSTTPSAPAAPTPFETGLLAALAADDPEVRAQSLALLGRFGEAGHVSAIGPLVDDPDPDVRSAAIAALGSLAGEHPDARRAVTPWLLRALRSSNRDQRYDVVRELWSAEADDWSDLVGCLADQWPALRAAAAAVLSHHGVPIHPRDVADLLADDDGSPMRSWVLDQLVDPAQRDLLAPWLASPDLRTRDRAAEAQARLEAIAAGAATSWRSPDRQERERADAENEAARERLRGMPWRAAARGELVRAAAAARLVMFGEIHSDGPLRDTQCALLAAYAGARPEQVVVGFEPSVQGPQQPVLDLAARLGMATLPLEQHWQTLLPRGRHAERDDEAAAAINACLAGAPDRRMFVVRGEGHLLPGGHLLQQLRETPLLVLSVQPPPLAAIGDDPQLLGRTFRLDDGVWWCGVEDTFAGAPELRDWLAARPPGR